MNCVRRAIAEGAFVLDALPMLDLRTDHLVFAGNHGAIGSGCDASRSAEPATSASVWSAICSYEAVRAYEHLRRLLRDELGLDPSPACRALHEQLPRDHQ